MMRALHLVFALAIACSSMAQLPEWANGLCGESLKEAVRMHCSPVKTLVGGDVWHALLEIDAVDANSVLNRFEEDAIPLQQGGSAPSGVTMLTVIDKSWWMPDFAFIDTYCRDLHVLYPSGEDVVAVRKNYMPGEPSETIFYDNGIWRTGEDEYGQGVWTFPESYRGEMARAILYAACIYPADLWVGPGAVFMEAGRYPSLSSGAVKMLTEIHAEESPNDREKMRSEAVSEIQGNVNPFVEWPALADHIWGDLKDVPCGNDRDDVEDVPEMKSLRGIYSRADETIDLVSPFVPDDAVWAIDGVSTEEKRIPVESLKKGKHELTFSAAGCHGKITVLITD